MGDEHLLEVNNLKVHFRSGKKTVRAVDGISFKLGKKENLGIVGESGSGKSVTATALMRLIPSPPGKIADGEIIFEGENILKYSNRKMRDIRGNEISMIFQDPTTSLNPVYTVGNQLLEAIQTHQQLSKKDAQEKAVEMLELVGIPEARRRLKMYPHEFSGGMRQRVMIAIALSCNPKLLIADEPTTALDVTVQAQILELMKKLQDEIDTSIIMITHDLGVVWELCDNVLVMYAGHMVESGPVQSLHSNPLHPYTWGLLDSQITSETESDELLRTVPGAPPNLMTELPGCPFADRCVYAQDICREKKPEMLEVEENHFVACHFQTEDSRLERRGGDHS
ncbi:MAG TPA: ABC transporter ATP-binding protein [Bacillota bacterium]|nr:ABC transporter ATP-binding protein [Bacillota bacterium]